MILFKERGVKEAMAVWVGAWVLAFSVGGILAQIVL
jgi:ferrous iron transport protein B